MNLIPWKKSLRARLVGPYLALSLAMIVVAGWLAYRSARQALEKAVTDRLAVFATLGEDRLRRWIDDQRQDILLLSTTWEVREAADGILPAGASGLDSQDRPDARKESRSALEAYLDARSDLQDDLGEVMVLDEVGRVVFATDRELEGQYRVRDRFFAAGRAGTYLSPVYPSPLTFAPTLTVATPLRGSRLSGVLAVHLRLEEVDRILHSPGGLGDSAEAYLVDRFNVFISGERFGRSRFPRGVHTDGIDAAVAGADGAGPYDNYDGVPVLGVYRWLDDLEVALLVEVAQAEAFAPAGRVARRIVVAGLLLAMVFAVVSVLLARQIARPILAIARSALRVADGDLETRVPVTTEDEIGVLAETFNRMTARLRVLYSDLRREIAERRVIQEQRETVVRELEAKNAELERFTYTVSHDLKSPLFTILGFLGFVEKGLDSDDRSAVREDLERVRGAARTMQQLLEDLLELSRVGRRIDLSERVDLGEVAREAVASVAGRITDRGVEVVVDPGLPVVPGDRVRLREVFQNLVENAVKFMGDRAEPRVEIGVGPEGAAGGPACFVRDNGRGIEEEYREKIFGLFERLDTETEGTGIGLALVRRIVELHGGRIWVESAGRGHGATFLFTLPAGESGVELDEVRDSGKNSAV